MDNKRVDVHISSVYIYVCVSTVSHTVKVPLYARENLMRQSIHYNLSRNSCHVFLRLVKYLLNIKETVNSKKYNDIAAL